MRLHYEELQGQVLGCEPQPGVGLAVLMRHGLGAWMDAWSRCRGQTTVPRCEIVAVVVEMTLGASPADGSL